MRRAPCLTRALVTVLAAVFSIPSFSFAADVLDEPLQLGNQQPLAQLFNLPTMRSGAVLPADATVWRGAADVANNWVRAQDGNESLVLDGESQRYTLGVRRGLGSGWEVGVAVPWVSYNGGTLDNFIEGWHHFWGLPSGGRPDYSTRQLNFVYQRNGRTELDFHRAESGVGDAQIAVAYQFLSDRQRAVTASATLNLPTGDVDKLTGSGNTSAALALAATYDQLFDLPLSVTANIGGQWLPHSEVLSIEQNSSAWFAAAELSWAVAQDWRLKAQLQTNTALYDSGLRALGSESMQLLLGGSVQLSPRWILEAAVGEDVAVDTASDVTLQLALKARY